MLMTESLHILLIASDPADTAALARPLVQAGFRPELRAISTGADYTAALGTDPDLLIVCHPSPIAIEEVVAHTESSGTDLPILVIAPAPPSIVSESTGRAVLAWVNSDWIGDLGAAARQTIERCRARAAQRRAEDKAREIARGYDRLRGECAQLRALAAEQAVALERERKRVADTVRDELEQRLIAVQFRTVLLDRMADGALHAVCKEMADLFDAALACARRLGQQLTPPLPHTAGLVPSLEWLARQIEEEHKLPVHLATDGNSVLERETAGVLVFETIRGLLVNVARHAEATAAWITLVHDNGEIRVEVRDDGVGFDALMAGDRKTGSGLFAAREWMAQIGATMEVETGPGRGCRCTLRLPRKSRDLRRPGPTRLRILLVDDHAVLREALAHLLSEEPDMVVVGEAADGAAAVDLTRRLRPDVVLMDINLPTMDGVEATRRIRAEHPRARVIGLSMFEAGGLASAAIREAGAVEYLSKSGPPELLLKAIRSGNTAPPIFPFRPR